VIDREARDQRAHEARDRVAEREQAEILCARRRRTELARRVLRRDLKHHEPGPEHGGACEQRRQPRQRHRQCRADGDRRGAEKHRATDADAIRVAARGDGGEHREERVECHQHADGQRTRSLIERGERDGDAATREHRVIRDAKDNQLPERSAPVLGAVRLGGALPLLAAHGASRSMVQ
jgi:hypothetical protein